MSLSSDVSLRNSCSEEQEQPAGLSTAESFSLTSATMKREGGHDEVQPNKSNSSNPIEEMGSNINTNTQFHKISVRRGSQRSSSGSLSPHSNGSLRSLTNSAPTILVHTPDDDSYHRVNQPLRSSMTSRTLHDSLHLGKKAGQHSRSRSVSFASVYIREYERILGDNPSCTSGPPLSIGWRFTPSPVLISVDDFEDGKGGTPRSSSEYLVPKAIRERMLKEHAGVSRRDIVDSVRRIQKQKSQRRKTVVNLGMQGTEEKVEIVRRSLQKAIGSRKSYSKEEKKLWDDAHERAVEKAKQLEESIRKGENISMRNVYSVGTPMNSTLPSRKNSIEYHSQSAEERHEKTDRRLSEGEAKEEEEAPPSSDHEVVSEGVGIDSVKSQEPEPLRRSIVICEENDEDGMFEKLLAQP